MRSLSIAVLLGLLASAPAVAQVSSPGPVYYNSAAMPPGVYDPAGPAYYNQSGAPIPGAPPAQVSVNPPYIPAPQGGMVSANPPHYTQPRVMGAPNPRVSGGRWGANINGRWWGGAQAPGGWGAYRRPRRGFTLQAYGMGTNFGIPDFATFGLRAPGQGFFWVRYYDDAVLVDAGGRVWDSVSGIAWADAEAYAGDGYAAASSAAYAGTGAGYRQPIEPVDPNRYYGRPGGYAPPDAGEAPAVQFRGAPDAGVYYGNGARYGSQYGSTTTYYGAPGTTTTTVVIQPATMVTTTVEEVTTTYVARSHVVHRAYHPKPRRCCACGCR